MLKHASEKIILIVLLKLNLLGALATAYQDVYVNGCWLKSLHIDSFIVALKRIVKAIYQLEEVFSFLLFSYLDKARTLKSSRSS